MVKIGLIIQKIFVLTSTLFISFSYLMMGMKFIETIKLEVILHITVSTAITLVFCFYLIFTINKNKYMARVIIPVLLLLILSTLFWLITPVADKLTAIIVPYLFCGLGALISLLGFLKLKPAIRKNH